MNDCIREYLALINVVQRGCGHLWGRLPRCIAAKNPITNWKSALEERVRCRSRPPGGVNTQSHIRDQFLTSGLKRWFIFTPVYQPDCSSDPELTSRFCSADWSMRGNDFTAERRQRTRTRTTYAESWLHSEAESKQTLFLLLANSLLIQIKVIRLFVVNHSNKSKSYRNTMMSSVG